MDKKPLIILTGPTAVGKTELSIRLAQAIGGEIISADSMQVYKNMDIGTAKITADEMEEIPHYLVDIMEPQEDFNVTLFQQKAKEAMKDIYARGKIPIIVGGTGFYIQSILYDIDFTEDNNDYEYRKELESLSATKGNHVLYTMLQEIDPDYAKTIHENNVKRVIRALEYNHLTGELFSAHNKTQSQKKSPYNFLYFVLTMNRHDLYGRINKRIDKMMEEGLVEEVSALLAKGLTLENVSMQGLGYKEIAGYLKGDMTLEEAVYVLKRDTRHFAKRQLTWFKREPRVTWIDKDSYANITQLTNDILDKITRGCEITVPQRNEDENERNI